FLDALTAGNTVRLRRFVPSSPNYLVHDGDAANERRVHLTHRGDALRYFARRHRARERARMISLRVAPGLDANHVLVTLRLTRTAADFPGRGITTRLAAGTGRVSCVTGRVERLLIQGPG